MEEIPLTLPPEIPESQATLDAAMLEHILTKLPIDDWLQEKTFDFLAGFRTTNKLKWAHIQGVAKDRGAPWHKQLESMAIDRQKKARNAKASMNGHQSLIGLPAGMDWRAVLDADQKGSPKQNIPNIRVLLANGSAWAGKFWWDSVKQRPMVDTGAVTDTLIDEMVMWLGIQCRMNCTNIKMIEHAVSAECRTCERDLLQEWLAALPQVDSNVLPILSTWLCDIAGTVNTPLGQFISMYIPVSMVARAIDPGCIQRRVAILEGPQEFLKSTLVRELAGEQWCVELSIGLDSKEAHMMLNGSWVAELPELDAVSRTQDPRLKAFFSMRKDSFIPKYSNFRVDHPRRTIFIGTTNETKYLKDQTGNSRYLPIAITKPIEIDKFLAMREVIFAEALAFYQAHRDDWWMMDFAVQAEADEQREIRRLPSIYEDALRIWVDGGLAPGADLSNPRYIDNQNDTCWSEIASRFLNIEPEKWKDSNLTRQIADGMRAIGWHEYNNRRHGNQKRGWYRL